YWLIRIRSVFAVFPSSELPDQQTNAAEHNNGPDGTAQDEQGLRRSLLGFTGSASRAGPILVVIVLIALPPRATFVIVIRLNRSGPAPMLWPPSFRPHELVPVVVLLSARGRLRHQKHFLTFLATHLLARKMINQHY